MEPRRPRWRGGPVRTAVRRLLHRRVGPADVLPGRGGGVGARRASARGEDRAGDAEHGGLHGVPPTPVPGGASSIDFTARLARLRMSTWSASSKLIAEKAARASISFPRPP